MSASTRPRLQPRRTLRALFCVALGAAGVASIGRLHAAETPPAASASLAFAPPRPIESERGLPLVRNFPPRAYGGANQVWGSVVARDGTVFFGGNSQLLEFDGLNWSTIPVPNAAHVRAVTVDRDDTVWVGGVNELGRVTRGPDGRRTYESLRALVPKEAGDLKDFWCAFATPEGIWFQSNQVVLRWRDGKFDTWIMGERSITLSFWLGDHLLVAREKGWFRPRPKGEWEQVGDPAAKLGDYLPHFAVPHPAGGWLMGLEGPKGEVVGLARWDGAKLTPEPHALDPWFKAKRYYSAQRLTDGRIIITTLQGGLVVLGPDLSFQTLLNEQAGLPSDVIINATEDIHGAVWLSTEFGVSRVQLHPAYTWFSGPSGLNQGNAHPTVRWRDQLLIGSTQGLMRLAPATQVPELPRLERWTLVDDKVKVFAEFGDRLIVGALGGSWQVTSAGALKLDNLTNIFEIVPSRVQPGRLYLATINGVGVLRDDAGKFTRETIVRGARGNTLVETDDGSLWVGSDNQGAWRVRVPTSVALAADPKTAADVKNFGAAAGLPAGSGHTKVERIAGAPLFLTPQGLFRFDEGTQRFRPEPAYGRRFADGTAAVRNIIEDGGGGAWLIATPPGGQNPNNVAQLGYAQGERWQQLPIPDLERIGGFADLRLETVEGRELLWVNGQSAVLRIDLTTWRALGDPVVGATVLRELATTDGRTLAPNARGELRVHSSENSLRFRFGTPGLAGESDVRHETRLSGFADGGMEFTASSERAFTNLPAGTYTFEARGRSADGRWSSPAQITFRVLAPWWQTVWAWIGYVLAFGLSLFTYVRWRIHRLTRERTRLEGVVAERTAELATKNRELERLNLVEQDEKLAALLSEEKARLELLRYQLNPHFLFNSLNSIRALVFAHPEAAGEMVTKLAEFCRWTLTRGSDETATVSDELEMVRTYLDVEKVRWQEALVTELVVDDDARSERLPQFLLLPLIENAIKYGSKTSPGTLQVRVSIQLDGDFLACEVANTGRWVIPATESTPTSTLIGLDNLRQRLVRHYGPACQLEIVRDPGWVRMRLRLKRGLPATPPKRSSREPFINS
jgi:hypothetical protein